MQRRIDYSGLGPIYNTVNQVLFGVTSQEVAIERLRSIRYMIDTRTMPR